MMSSESDCVHAVDLFTATNNSRSGELDSDLSSASRRPARWAACFAEVKHDWIIASDAPPFQGIPLGASQIGLQVQSGDFFFALSFDLNENEKRMSIFLLQAFYPWSRNLRLKGFPIDPSCSISVYYSFKRSRSSIVIVPNTFWYYSLASCMRNKWKRIVIAIKHSIWLHSKDGKKAISFCLGILIWGQHWRKGIFAFLIHRI